jgi:ATP-binding cassette subfamily C protein CydC
MALAGALGLLTVTSGIGLMSTSAYVLSSAALHPSIAELQVAIVAVRAFGLTRGLFRYLERLVTHQATFQLLGNLRVDLYRRLEPLAPARLEAFRRSDLLSRLIADIEILQEFYARVLAPPITALAVSLILGVVFGRVEPRLACLWLGFVLLAGLAVPMLTYALARHPAHGLLLGRARLQMATMDLIQGIADLSLFGRRADHLDRILSLNASLAREQTRLAAVSGAHAGLAGMLVSLAAAGMLVAAAPLVLEGRIPGVFLSVLVLAVMAAFEAFAPLPLAAQHLNSSRTAAQRLLAIVEASPAVLEPLLPQAMSPASDLRLQSVTFSYGTGLPAALHELSFELPAGRSVALVGPSGSGKSTLAHLLQRFWDYDAGRIFLGGVELHQLDSIAVRSRLAVLPQRIELFAGSIADNLLLGAPEASEQALWQALQTAGLESTVREMPDGLQTWIGEQGMQLSGGERQRLALARTLLHPAPILILDEPTAQLDAPAQAGWMQRLRPATQGRSLLLITHLLHGLEAVDEILVLHLGRVIERGTHAELLLRKGVFRRMWERHQQSMAVETWGASGGRHAEGQMLDPHHA